MFTRKEVVHYGAKLACESPPKIFKIFVLDEVTGLRWSEPAPRGSATQNCTSQKAAIVAYFHPQQDFIEWMRLLETFLQQVQQPYSL
jgi:hypothetical protein